MDKRNTLNTIIAVFGVLLLLFGGGCIVFSTGFAADLKDARVLAGTALGAVLAALGIYLMAWGGRPDGR